jgi:hypothetical protein
MVDEAVFKLVHTPAPHGLSREHVHRQVNARIAQLNESALDDLASAWLVRLALPGTASGGDDRSFVTWLASSSVDCLLDRPGDLETFVDGTGVAYWMSGTRDLGCEPATMLAISFLDDVDAFR